LGESSFCCQKVRWRRPLGFFLKTMQEHHRLTVNREHHSGDAVADMRPHFPQPGRKFSDKGHPYGPAELSRFYVLSDGFPVFSHQLA